MQCCLDSLCRARMQIVQICRQSQSPHTATPCLYSSLYTRAYFGNVIVTFPFNVSDLPAKCDVDRHRYWTADAVVQLDSDETKQNRLSTDSERSATTADRTILTARRKQFLACDGTLIQCQCNKKLSCRGDTARRSVALYLAARCPFGATP